MELDAQTVDALITVVIALGSGLVATSVKWRKAAKIAGEAIDLLKTAKDAVAPESVGGKEITPKEAAQQLLKDIEAFIAAWA